MLYENYNAGSAICQYYKKHYSSIGRTMLLSMLILGYFGLLSILKSYYGIPALQISDLNALIHSLTGVHPP
jgi:hypothetical protein